MKAVISKKGMKKKYYILIYLVLFQVNPILATPTYRESKLSNKKNTIENTIKSENIGEKKFLLTHKVKNNKIQKKAIIIKLEDLTEIIKNNNPRLKIQDSKIKQSKSLLKSEIAAWYPSLDLSANGLPQYLNGNTYNNSSTDTSSKQLSSSISAKITWNIIDPKRIPSITSARKKYEKEIHSYSILLRDLNLEAVKRYYKLQKSISEVRIANKALKLSEINLKDSQLRLDSGIGTKFEVLEAKTQLSRDQQLLSEKIGQRKINRSSLVEILNLPEDVIPKVESIIGFTGFWSQSLDESIAASLSYRKEINNIKLDISINDNNAKAAIAASRPILSLVNTINSSATKGQANVVNPDWDNSSSTLSNTISLNATWSVFDGGKSKSLYDFNKQKAQESEFNLTLKKAEIRKETKESFFKLQTLKDKIKTTSNQIKSAEEALRLAQLRYKAGLTTQREIVNNQRDLTEAEVSYIGSITDYNIEISELKRKTGIDVMQSCIGTDIDFQDTDIKDKKKDTDYAFLQEEQCHFN